MNHGTYARYIHGKCRCEPCRQANSDYKQAWRLKRFGRPGRHATNRWGKPSSSAGGIVQIDDSAAKHALMLKIGRERNLKW